MWSGAVQDAISSDMGEAMEEGEEMVIAGGEERKEVEEERAEEIHNEMEVQGLEKDADADKYRPSGKVPRFTSHKELVVGAASLEGIENKGG